MKKLLIGLLVLGSFSAFADQSQVSCLLQYKEKADGMMPKSESGKTAVKIGAGIATAGAMIGTIAIGAGPLGLIAGASAGKAYLDKIDRLNFFHDLILAANQSKQAPISPTGLSGLFEDTRFNRIVRMVNRLSNKRVNEDKIMEALSQADTNGEFCLDESGNVDLKTSIRGFAKVIVRNL